MALASRRRFLGTASLAGSYFIATGRPAWSDAANERLNVACIGVGGKGSSDSDNAAMFGNVIAICDVDRKTLASKGNAERFKEAEHFTDYRELLAKHGPKIDICVVSTPDHMHAPVTLDALRMGISCYTQKPLTRTLYESRLIARLAAEAEKKGACTQMGNQGTSLATSREAIAMIEAGVLGTPVAVHAWSNRPIWAQGPKRRMTLRTYQAQALAEVEETEAADVSAEQVAKIVADLVAQKRMEVEKALTQLDWKNWLGVAPPREFWPGLYHSFQHRGWWDFGTGALGDMACHMLTVPYAALELRDPDSVVARTTGHDFDSFPASSTIRYEFAATKRRPAIPLWWYDRKGNKPPAEVFAKWGIDEVGDRGVLIVGEKGAFLSLDDYCSKYELKGVEKMKVDFEPAEDLGKGFDVNNMYEFFRAKQAGQPRLAKSNFVDRACGLTETVLLGNLAVWAAAKGGDNGGMGEWGETIEWDGGKLEARNLAALKTPGIAGLIKPTYPAGYRLDS
jgi:predicted dehydrogenase